MQVSERFGKKAILGLLFLVTLVTIFVTPGRGDFESFSSLFTQTGMKSYFDHIIFSLIKYPISINALYRLLLIAFPLNKNIYFFYRQNVWLVSKFLLFSIFLVSLASMFLMKSKQFKKLDVLFTFFSTLAILLISVSLGFSSIFAVPFFMLSLYFLKGKKPILSGILYLVAISFNWSLLVFAPLFWVYLINPKDKKTVGNIIQTLVWFVIPILFSAGYFYLIIDQTWARQIEDVASGYVPISLLSVVNSSSKTVDAIRTSGGNYLIPFIEIGIQSLLVIYLFRSLLFKNLSLKFSALLSFFLVFLFFLLILIFPNYLFLIFTLLFVLVYLKLIFSYKNRKDDSLETLLEFSLVSFLLFVFIFPILNESSLIWIPVISLALYLMRPSRYNHLRLTLLNIVTFSLVYLFIGISGSPPVRGVFFGVLREMLVFVVFFLAIYRAKFALVGKKLRFNFLKWFLFIFIFLLLVSHIPAFGDPDMGEWVTYAKSVIYYVDPFLAHTQANQLYGPFSNVFLALFPVIFNWFFVNPNFIIAIKLQVFVFYLLTLFIIYLATSKETIKKPEINIDKILLFFSVFSLALQTLGMGDINIYLTPFLIGAVYYLFKNKYFVSGIMLGIAVSIKWQPFVLLPLFGAYTFHFFKPLKNSLSDSLKFLASFVPIVVGAWLLVIREPNGYHQFKKIYDLYTGGGVYLSGQALNLNWIVTYFIHIFWPSLDYPLSALGNLNRQIASNGTPFIFQGILFKITAFLIVAKFWFTKKKDLPTFLLAAVAIFFSHHILNVSAMEKHLFYVVIFMLYLYLVKPTRENKMALVLFDLMSFVNIMLFYGFTGEKWFPRLFFTFDITVLFALYYLTIYLILIFNYFRKGKLFQFGKVEE